MAFLQRAKNIIFGVSLPALPSPVSHGIMHFQMEGWLPQCIGVPFKINGSKLSVYTDDLLLTLTDPLISLPNLIKAFRL